MSPVAFALIAVMCGCGAAAPQQPRPAEPDPPVVTHRPPNTTQPLAGKFSRGFTTEDAEVLGRLEATCLAANNVSDTDTAQLEKALAIQVGSEGVVVSEYGDAIYGDPRGDQYLGRVSHDARVRYVGGYGFTIHCTTQMKVYVISNEWSGEVGKTGWVGIGDLGDWR